MDAVPQIIDLLKDSDENVRLAGEIAIGKLAENRR
jgi:HEAT repeat protein